MKEERKNRINASICLTDKEKDVYEKIIKNGNMNDMLIFAYYVGRASLAEEQLNNLTL